MIFNGFEVYPCGNAVLSVNNNILTVAGISNSGLDGVLIKVQNTDSYVVNYGSLEALSLNNGVLKSSSLVKNPFGQVISLLESYRWFNSASNNIIMGYNKSLLPNEYTFWGKLNGQEVFSIKNSDIPNSLDPKFPPPVPSALVILWPVVVAACGVAVALWASLRSKDTTTITRHYDAENHLTGTTVTSSHDPIPFEIQIGGNVYTITEYGISYTGNLPLIGYPSMEIFPVGQQITGCNIPSFQITSIQAL